MPSPKIQNTSVKSVAGLAERKRSFVKRRLYNVKKYRLANINPKGELRTAR